MKMHAIIIKHGFAVIVAICYISLLRNPVITIFKIVGCEDCVQENKLPCGNLGAKHPATGQFLQFLRKRNNHFYTIWMTFCMFLEQFEKA